MSLFKRYAGVAVLAAIVAALGISSAVFAQETTTAVPSLPLAHGGMGFGRGMCGEAGFAAAAQALGMTTDELSTQLWGGETLSSLAEQAGVDLQAVRDAVQAACQEATKAAIEQAVQNGNMTRDKADWLLEGLEKGYWGGEMPGFGMGRGGFHGPRGFRGFGGFGSFGAPNGNRPDTSTGGA